MVIVSGVILAVALTALCITGQITRPVVSETGVAYDQKLNFAAFGYRLEQDFVPQHQYLDLVRVYVDTLECVRDVGTLQVSVLNQNGECMFETSLPISELPQYGWVEIPVHTQLAPGQINTFILESVDCVDHGPSVSFVDPELAADLEQQDCHLVYAGLEVENLTLRTAFHYVVPVEWYEYLVYYVFGLLLIVLVIHVIVFCV